MQTVTYQNQKFKIRTLGTLDGEEITVATNRLDETIFDVSTGWFRDAEAEKIDAMVTLYVPSKVFYQSKEKVVNYFLNVIHN